jgi:hypothetical protein
MAELQEAWRALSQAEHLDPQHRTAGWQTPMQGYRCERPLLDILPSLKGFYQDKGLTRG